MVWWLVEPTRDYLLAVMSQLSGWHTRQADAIECGLGSEWAGLLHRRVYKDSLHNLFTGSQTSPSWFAGSGLASSIPATRVPSKYPSSGKQPPIGSNDPLEISSYVSIY